MREILFRGKRTDNGEWVKGYYCNCVKAVGMETIPSIQQTDDNSLYFREVIPETVGQFTGLTDKNGKKIFEGDIVKVKTEYVDETIYLVAYRDCGFKLIYRPSNGVVNLTNNKSRNIEVIGNKWDNPELLGE